MSFLETFKAIKCLVWGMHKDWKQHLDVVFGDSAIPNPVHCESSFCSVFSGNVRSDTVCNNALLPWRTQVMFAVKKSFKTNALWECSYLSTVIALIFLSAEPEFCWVIFVQACEPSTSLCLNLTGTVRVLCLLNKFLWVKVLFWTWHTLL